MPPRGRGDFGYFRFQRFEFQSLEKNLSSRIVNAVSVLV